MEEKEKIGAVAKKRSERAVFAAFGYEGAMAWSRKKENEGTTGFRLAILYWDVEGLVCPRFYLKQTRQWRRTMRTAHASGFSWTH